MAMDDLFFYSSKVIWSVISPDSLFALLLAATVGMFYLNYHILARRLLTFLFAAVVVLSLFPVGSWMLYPLETRFQHNPELAAQVDGIIVLGGSINAETSEAWQQLEMYYSAERLTTFIELARRYPDAKLIFTGGNASINRNKPTEASILNLHWHQLGLDPERIQFENQAKNTAENAYFTKQLAKPLVDSKWVLITTAFHMPRSIGVFCQNSWSLIPYPVDHQVNPGKLLEIEFNLLAHAVQLKLAIHEWLGLLAYYLTGKIPDLLPDTC
jgi:uncharacterized SAM-binding protein YcdF (DUF218 family)